MKNIAIEIWYYAFVEEDNRFEVLFLALETVYIALYILTDFKTIFKNIEN